MRMKYNYICINCFKTKKANYAVDVHCSCGDYMVFNRDSNIKNKKDLLAEINSDWFMDYFSRKSEKIKRIYYKHFSKGMKEQVTLINLNEVMNIRDEEKEFRTQYYYFKIQFINSGKIDSIFVEGSSIDSAKKSFNKRFNKRTTSYNIKNIEKLTGVYMVVSDDI